MSNQERRLMRRMQNVGSRSGMSLQDLARSVNSPAVMQEQQDERRDRLAERLLEIGLEDTRIGDFTDCHKREPVVDEAGEQKYVEDVPVLTVEEWFVKLANASMSAAEVIYPELPTSREHITDGSPCWCDPVTEKPLPATAQEGAQSVGGWPSEPSPASKPSIEQEGHARALIAQADRGEG